MFSTQTSVSLHAEQLDAFIAQIDEKVQTLKDKKLVFDKWADFHLKDITKYTIEQIAAYVFVIDAMNFCFWPNNPSGQFEYEHMARNLEKMLDTNPDFFTPNCLAKVQEEYLREHIFDGNK